MKIEFTTKQQLTSYLIDRYFESVDLQLLEELFSLKGDSLSDYVDTPYDFEGFAEYLSDLLKNTSPNIMSKYLNEDKKLSEFYDEYLDDNSEEIYPMWNTMWHDRHNITNDYSIDELWSKFKIGVLDIPDYYKHRILFITGAGYDFYDAHWIPLFSEIFNGLFKELEEDDLR